MGVYVVSGTSAENLKWTLKELHSLYILNQRFQFVGTED